MALGGLVIITTVDFEKGYIFSDTLGGHLPEVDKDANTDKVEKDSNDEKVRVGV